MFGVDLRRKELYSFGLQHFTDLKQSKRCFEVELCDEHTSVRYPPDPTLLAKPFHCLADGHMADTQLSGDLRFIDLAAAQPPVV